MLLQFNTPMSATAMKKTTAVASLPIFNSSPTDHTDIPVQSFFSQVTDFSQLPSPANSPRELMATFTKETKKLTTDL